MKRIDHNTVVCETLEDVDQVFSQYYPDKIEIDGHVYQMMSSCFQRKRHPETCNCSTSYVLLEDGVVCAEVERAGAIAIIKDKMCKILQAACSKQIMGSLPADADIQRSCDVIIQLLDNNPEDKDIRVLLFKLKRGIGEIICPSI